MRVLRGRGGLPAGQDGRTGRRGGCAAAGAGAQGPTCASCCQLPGHRRRDCCTRRPLSSSGLVRRRAHRCAWAPCPTATCHYVVGTRPGCTGAAAAPTGQPMAAGGPDNLQRFALLGLDGGAPGRRRARCGGSPSCCIAHDWHAAMACTYLAAHPANAVRSVFTVHNLAYLFPSHEFAQLACRWSSCSRTAWSTTASSRS